MKYKLTNQEKIVNGQKVSRIYALRDIQACTVKKGDLGGFVSSHANLSQEGDCWIGGDAVVLDTSCVSDDAFVSGMALVEQGSVIGDNAKVFGTAKVVASVMNGEPTVCDDAYVQGVKMTGTAQVVNKAKVEYSLLGGEVIVGDKAHVQYSEIFATQSYILDNATLETVNIGTEAQPALNVWIENDATVTGTNIAGDFIYILNHARIQGKVNINGSQVQLLDYVRVSGVVDIGKDVKLTDLVRVANSIAHPLSFMDETISGDILIAQ